MRARLEELMGTYGQKVTLVGAQRRQQRLLRLRRLDDSLSQMYDLLKHFSAPFLAGSLTYEALLDFWGQFDPYTMNTILVPNAVMLDMRSFPPRWARRR